jgi:predicted esterase
VTLGLVNGDLFRSVMAFSPGGLLEGEPHGYPRFFVAHGRQDDVIPIAAGGDAVVAELRSRGYRVTYRRHAGGHEVPRSASEAAVRWFLRGS